MKRGEKTVCPSGQQSRETTAFEELKPAWIQRAATLHRKNNNTGEGVTGAGIFSVGKA